MRSREEIQRDRDWEHRSHVPTSTDNNTWLILEVLLDIRELLVVERPGLAINTIRRELGQDIVKAMVGERKGEVKDGMD